MWEYTCKTAAGLELDIKLLSGKTKLELTKVKAGTGQVNPTQLASQTDVAEAAGYIPELGEQHILDATTVEIPVILNNQAIDTGFNLWQIGIYARDPDKGEILYFIAQNEEARKIPGQEQPGFIIETEFVIGVGNAAEVTAKVDPAGTLTRNEADKRYAALEHPHEIVNVLGLDAALDTKADLKDVAAALDTKANSSDVDLMEQLLADDITSLDNKATLALAGKVDKVAGKELSANDLTNELKGNYDDAYIHLSNMNNPHGVTKVQVGLSNVDNTADTAKPISTAQQEGLDKKVDKVAGKGLSTNDLTADLKSKYDNAYLHLSSKTNPHGVTKDQVGLGSVPNVATNDQTPTFTAAASMAPLTSGEKLTIALGKIAKAITDLIAHIGNKSNPHGVTRAQVGLGNVDNTADTAKPISTAQQTALNKKADLDSTGKVPASQLPSFVDDVLEYSGKTAFPATGETGKIYVDTATNLTYRWSGSAYVEISPSLALGETPSTAYPGDKGKVAYEHSQNKANPHVVTKGQVGLGSVPNVATNDQTPTFTAAASMAPLASGEKLTTAFAKIAKAITDLIAHIGNKSNPHAVTKAQVGLGNVPNVATNSQTPTFVESAADEDIVSGENLSTIFGKILKSIKTIRTGLAGKAAASHNHSAANITSGTLPITRGGTGQTTAAGIRNSLGLGNTTGALPVANGGTGQTTLSGVKSALGVTALENNFENIISDETIAAAERAGIDLTSGGGLKS